jgi:hypothetical protein
MLHIAADPDELGELYARCIRCLYLHYRNGKDVGARSDTEWAASIVGYHAEEDWYELSGTPRFRFRSYGEMIESRGMKYADFDFTLSFAGRYDALLELEDGSVVLSKCLERTNESSPKLHQWGLHGYAFALEHPRTMKLDSIKIQTLGVLEFKMTPTGGGKHQVTPSRLSLLERQPERFANWMRVVARLLAARTPPALSCPVCAKL